MRTSEGHEVDFLARADDGTVELIQVCDDASVGKTADRELRALAEAGRVFPSATKRLLTRSRRGLPAQWPADVEAQPAYEWILA